MLIRVLTALESPKEEKRIKGLVGRPGVLLSSLREGESLWERIGESPFDVIVVGRTTLEEPSGETVRAIRGLPAAPDVIVLAEGEDGEEQGQLLAAGCLAVFDPRLSDGTLRDSFRTLFERRREEFRLRLLSRRGRQQLGDFVSSSPAMKQLLSVARKVATSDATLLVLGETGVGKEWLARAIHSEGPRSGGPFLAVNCGAIPEGLLESELFGHKKGAFTGAIGDRRGHFELAHGGTLFLDEIGETPSAFQVKLLRVLQEKTIQPVGSERTIEVDVRLMAATNRDVQHEMAEQRLRRDLYYRLAVVTLTVPPLRERPEDIPDLVENHFEIFRARVRQDVYGIDREAMSALVAYDWPGNVRELINVIERAVLLCDGEEITLGDFPEVIAGGKSAQFSPSASSGPDPLLPLEEAWLQKPLREARREVAAAFERRYLSTLLKQTGGRIGDTAKRAGMSPRALFDRMQQLGLRKEDFRTPPGVEPGPPRENIAS